MTRSSSPETRVCDWCIKRKIKCDQRRPTCSRCHESGRDCTYSHTKRQPGPCKGSSRGRGLRSALHRPQQLLPGESGRARAQPPRPSTTSKLLSIDQTDVSNILTLGTPQGRLPRDNDGDYGECNECGRSRLSVDNATYKQALELFFDHFSLTLPIFDQQTILASYARGVFNKHVLDAIAAFSLVGLNASGDIPNSNARQCLAHLIDHTDCVFASRYRIATLEDFQLECLLAYYILHHRANRHAWFRVGRMVRLAYAIGLNQLDNTYTNLKFDNVIRPTDLELWRNIWWTVFMLDTCLNQAAMTPPLVELESIRTTLHKAEGPGQRDCHLPSDALGIPELVRYIGLTRTGSDMPLGTALQTLLRHCGNTFRLEIQNPQTPESTLARVKTLSRTVEDVKRAIPDGYAQLTQVVFMGESASLYARRLLNNLVFRLCTFFLEATLLLSNPPRHTAKQWDVMVDACAAIVAVFEHLNLVNYCVIEPAVCYAASCVLTFEEVYNRTVKGSSELDRSNGSDLVNHTAVLNRFLIGLSAYWGIAQSLLDAHRNFSACMPQQLSYEESRVALRLYQGVLHQKWLLPMPRPAGGQEGFDSDHGVPEGEMWLEVFNSIDWTQLSDWGNSGDAASILPI